VAIDIARYDPAWPEQFRAEASRLTELLDPWLATPVEHIGSTSVPGLAAKPVLDMLAGVHDLHAAEAAIPVLTSHGYVHAQHRPATWCMRGIWRMPLGRLPCWTQAFDAGGLPLIGLGILLTGCPAGWRPGHGPVGFCLAWPES
jgi:GrpB-like predicted nucleotidyltransferase (UPF0157 family)